MATTKHERALRVIVVSGRQALKKAGTPEEHERLAARTHELLADLERQVIRDGADERMLAAIEHERRRLFDG